MNNDLISRSALLENIEKSRKAHASVRSRLTVGDMEQMINGARPVDAEVVRHAYWHELLGCGYTVCSACDFIPYTVADKYCPNCGARMDGGADGD